MCFSSFRYFRLFSDEDRLTGLTHQRYRTLRRHYGYYSNFQGYGLGHLLGCKDFFMRYCIRTVCWAYLIGSNKTWNWHWIDGCYIKDTAFVTTSRLLFPSVNKYQYRTNLKDILQDILRNATAFLQHYITKCKFRLPTLSMTCDL